MQYLLLSHDNSGYVNALQCYVYAHIVCLMYMYILIYCPFLFYWGYQHSIVGGVLQGLNSGIKNLLSVSSRFMACLSWTSHYCPDYSLSNSCVGPVSDSFDAFHNTICAVPSSEHFRIDPS
jgi:hypothetical protein